MPGRRIAAVLVAACALGGAAVALSAHVAASGRRLAAAPVQVNPAAPGMRDVPVPVPLPRRRFHGPALHTPVPVLMYHAIGMPPAGAPYPELFVSRGLFRAQMRALAAAGYHAVTLDHVWRAWHGRAALPAGPSCSRSTTATAATSARRCRSCAGAAGRGC